MHQAVIERRDNNEIHSYIGIREGPFKLGYNRHMYNNTFRRARHKNSTSLSKYIWNLKDNNIESNFHKVENHKTM